MNTSLPSIFSMLRVISPCARLLEQDGPLQVRHAGIPLLGGSVLDLLTFNHVVHKSYHLYAAAKATIFVAAGKLESVPQPSCKHCLKLLA